VHVTQACFTAFLRTFCKRLKREYGRDQRLSDKITQVEHFCSEVGQHLLVRPHNARCVPPLCMVPQKSCLGPPVASLLIPERAVGALAWST
jgi:hypothetical protein